MFDSFIIGALTSLVFGIFYYGWKFLRLKEPTKKQLMTRIAITSIFLIFNLIMIFGNIFTLNSINEDGIGFMIITMLILLAISIPLCILLVKDITKYSLINKSDGPQNCTLKIISLSTDNLEEGYFLDNDSSLKNNYNKKDVVNTTKYNNESLILNIISLERIQIIVLSLICVFILFLVFYPIGMKCIFNNKIPDKTEYKTTKLTNLDANKKVYHISEDNYNYIYVEKDNKIILYRFNNSSMYSSSKIEKTGYATSLQIKDYFEDKLVSGYPTISSIMPEIIPIGVIIGLLFIVSITIMLIYIHRIAHEIVFKLGQTHKDFKRLKVDYKNEVISKYDYNKLNKQYLSELVIKNNACMGLFKIFY